MESYRALLHLFVRSQLADHLSGKVDLSGVVQQTLIDAHKRNGAWEDWDERRRIAWLRQALSNNLRDEVRRFQAAARDVSREVSINRPSAESNGVVGDWLAADHSSPSQRADRNESMLRMAAALAKLPPEQRLAIELHHLQGRSLSATADEMGKSMQSVVGLLFRGLKQLKTAMAGT